MCPGPMAAPLLAELRGGPRVADLLITPLVAPALGRIGAAEEIAATVASFASDGSSYTTGSIVIVDGGLTAGALPQRAQGLADDRHFAASS